MPSLVAWLQQLKPELIVYCPTGCAEARVAGSYLSIPCVSLMSQPGPGHLHEAQQNVGRPTWFLSNLMRSNEENSKALKRMRQNYDSALVMGTSMPFHADNFAELNIVTWIEDLTEPLNEDDEDYFTSNAIAFEYVGPLIDDVGSRRVGQSVDKNASFYAEGLRGIKEEEEDKDEKEEEEFDLTSTLAVCSMMTGAPQFESDVTVAMACIEEAKQ